jgi:Uncharacterized protein conserved in bacteria
MKTITEIIASGGCSVAKLVKKCEGSAKLKQVFQSIIEQDLSKYCEFAKYENSTLSVEIANSAWATKFRYLTADLIKQLRSQPEFHELKKIRYFVKKHQDPIVAPTIKKTSLTESNQRLWQQTLTDLKKHQAAS